MASVFGVVFRGVGGGVLGQTLVDSVVSAVRDLFHGDGLESVHELVVKGVCGRPSSVTSL